MKRIYVLIFFISLIGACTNSSSDYYRKGDVLYQLGKYEEAINAYEKAIEAASSDVDKYDPYFYLASSKLLVGDSSEALDIYTLMLSLYPDSASIYMNRALLYYDIDDITNSIDDLDKLTELEPDNVEALVFKAKTQVFIGDYENALSNLDYVIRFLDSKHLEAYEWRSVIKHKMGDEMGSKADFKIAEELGSEYNKNFIKTDIRLYGYIKDQQSKEVLMGSEVRIYIYKQEDWFEIRSIENDKDGIYHCDLDMDDLYKIEFIYPEYVSKSITLDLRRIPLEEQLYGYEMHTDMNLFPYQQGFDLSIMNDPIGKAKYNSSTATLEWDMDYTKEMKEKIEREKKD